MKLLGAAAHHACGRTAVSSKAYWKCLATPHQPDASSKEDFRTVLPDALMAISMSFARTSQFSENAFKHPWMACPLARFGQGSTGMIQTKSASHHLNCVHRETDLSVRPPCCTLP
jgi:hypothetical protein